MRDWVWLAIETLLAVTALRVMVNRVLPAVRAVNAGENDGDYGGGDTLLIDVWLPLTLAVPIVILAGQVGLQGHRGWSAAVGGPLALGLFALSLAWATAGTSGKHEGGAWPGGDGIRAGAALTWAASGVVMLLIGAAHQLTIIAGQCAFAIGAVLLWQNSPAENEAGARNHDHDGAGREKMERLAGDHVAAATLGAVLLAAGIGACCVLLAGKPASAALSQAIALAFGAASIAAASRWLSVGELLRVGGWTSTYGVMFSLGIMSLTKLSPIVTASILASEAQPLPPVARGMGIYTPEAMAFVALAGLAIATRALPRRTRRVLGWLLLIVTAAWLAWRLAQVASPGDDLRL